MWCGRETHRGSERASARARGRTLGAAAHDARGPAARRWLGQAQAPRTRCQCRRQRAPAAHAGTTAARSPSRRRAPARDVGAASERRAPAPPARAACLARDSGAVRTTTKNGRETAAAPATHQLRGRPWHQGAPVAQEARLEEGALPDHVRERLAPRPPRHEPAPRQREPSRWNERQCTARTYVRKACSVCGSIDTRASGRARAEASSGERGSRA